MLRFGYREKVDLIVVGDLDLVGFMWVFIGLDFLSF